MKDLLHSLQQIAPEDTATIPYAWVKQGKELGPTVTILGGVHGNETAGITVIQKLLQQQVKAGKLQLAVGNPEAVIAGKRYIDKDMNRCFGHPIAGVSDSVRAQMLKGLLANTDLLLDIHSTIKPSVPFMVIPTVGNLDHPYIDAVKKLGIATVVSGKGMLPPSGEPIYTDSFVEASAGVGVTVEAGWIEDPTTLQIQEGVMKALVHLGVLDESAFESDQNNAEPTFEKWDAYWNVLSEPGFTFTQDWNNFQKMSAGTTFATTLAGDLQVPEDSIILFPKPNHLLVQGQEACIIAKKI